MMRKCIIILFIVMLNCPFAWGQPQDYDDDSLLKPKQVASLKSFKRIAVLEGGRFKPLESFARNTLLQFSGKRTFEDQSAVQWLARLLFAPTTTYQDQIFLINNPSIAEALEVAVEKKRRYSLAQLEPALGRLTELAQSAQKIDPKNRDIVENEIIRVYENVKRYTDLSTSFSFAFPYPAFIVTEFEMREQLDLPLDISQFSFLDIALRADKLQRLALPLEKIPSEQWSDDQKQIIQLISSLFRWSLSYGNIPFKIIPSY